MKSTTVTPVQPITITTTRQQVEAALSPRRIQPVLRSFANGALAHKSASRRGGKAACHILDAKVEPGKRCSILYEVGEQMLIGNLTWPAKAQATAGAAPLPTMEIYPFEHDPGLPTLTTAMDSQAMLGMLNESLPECVAGTARLVRCRVTLLRYRLGKRCTLRYDLRLRDTRSGAITTRTLFGKLYHSVDKAEAVYREMQLLAASTERNTLVVARAVAYVPALPMVLQAPVADSAPLELLLQQPPTAQPDRLARVTEGIRRAAVALAELHQCNAPTERIRSVDAELEKLERRSSRIADTDVTTGVGLHRLAQILSARRTQLAEWGEEITPVHGDCKPSQFFLLADDRMALLDFDHYGMADPASDVGNFLATLRQMGIKQILKQRDPALVAAWQAWLATLENAFLDAYMASRPCHAAFRRRATWYQAMALLRKALRSYARSTRSPLPGLLVEEAGRVLEGC